MWTSTPMYSNPHRAVLISLLLALEIRETHVLHNFRLRSKPAPLDEHTPNMLNDYKIPVTDFLCNVSGESICFRSWNLLHQC